MAKATTADAVDPHQHDLMNTVLGPLYDKLTGGDGETLETRDAFFAWATPGIPISDDRGADRLAQAAAGDAHRPAARRLRPSGAGSPRRHRRAHRAPAPGPDAAATA